MCIVRHTLTLHWHHSILQSLCNVYVTIHVKRWDKSAKNFSSIAGCHIITFICIFALNFTWWPTSLLKYSYICTQTSKTNDCHNSNFCAHNARCAISPYMHPLHIVCVFVPHTPPDALQVSHVLHLISWLIVLLWCVVGNISLTFLKPQWSKCFSQVSKCSLRHLTLRYLTAIHYGF